MNFLDKYMMPIADKLNNNKYLTALREGFMLSLPLIIFGSVFVVISNLPYLDKIFGQDGVNQLKNLLGAASNSTLSIMTLFVIFGIGYSLCKQYKIEAIYGAAVSLASFIILTPTFFQYGKSTKL